MSIEAVLSAVEPSEKFTLSEWIQLCGFKNVSVPSALQQSRMEDLLDGTGFKVRYEQALTAPVNGAVAKDALVFQEAADIQVVKPVMEQPTLNPPNPTEIVKEPEGGGEAFVPDPTRPMSPAEWAKEFDIISRTPPETGDLIATEDGSRVKLSVELEVGKAPFIYTRIHVPCVVGGKLGWFAQSVNDTSSFGWKAILLPEARDQVIRKYGIGSQSISVKALEVERVSHSGSSVLCRVLEF